MSLLAYDHRLGVGLGADAVLMRIRPGLDANPIPIKFRSVKAVTCAFGGWLLLVWPQLSTASQQRVGARRAEAIIKTVGSEEYKEEGGEKTIKEEKPQRGGLGADVCVGRAGRVGMRAAYGGVFAR